jgi:hypothetical protein
LWYVFDVDVFQGTLGRMLVEVHFQLNMQDLKFQWQDSLYAAQYRVEGLLLDSRVQEAARDEYTETVKADEFKSTTQARLLPGQLSFDVAAGSYRLALRMIDTQSQNEGAYTTDVVVPHKDGSELALSDLQMATRIVYASRDWKSRFVKNDHLVVPNPIGIYQRGRELTGYFEIYGLTLDPEQLCRYKVTYQILPRGKVRGEGWLPRSEEVDKPFVSSTFSGTGNTPMRIEVLRIDIANLQQDVYDLVLTVQDLVAGNQATARSAFSIIE